MKMLKVLLGLGLATAVGMGLAACSSGEQAASDEVVQRAIVLHVDNGEALFADEETGAVYFPRIPEEGLFGLDGQTIAVEDLAPGNIVEVTGNGIMLESYPGQYPGITSISVVEEGSSAAVEPYAEEIALVYAASDPTGIPEGHLDYRTSEASTTVSLPPLTWEWDADDGFRQVSDATVFDESGIISSDLADARISEATKATLGFSVAANDVQVYVQPIVVQGDGYALEDADGPLTTVATTASGSGDFALQIEPNNLYTVLGFFDNGNVSYSFATF